MDCEFRGFESKVMGKPSPYHRPRTVLSMPVARPLLIGQKMSPETPKLRLEPKWGVADTHTHTLTHTQ